MQPLALAMIFTGCSLAVISLGAIEREVQVVSPSTIGWVQPVWLHRSSALVLGRNYRSGMPVEFLSDGEGAAYGCYVRPRIRSRRSHDRGG
jgi:hypothetical protein